MINPPKVNLTSIIILLYFGFSEKTIGLLLALIWVNYSLDVLLLYKTQRDVLIEKFWSCHYLPADFNSYTRQEP